MRHDSFQGTHYTAGFRWGSLLRERENFFLLDAIPFAVTEERRAFARECLPVYREHYPEALEEIQRDIRNTRRRKTDGTENSRDRKH